ncbi:MAG: SDR family NAD(P)-dependent oxidoreductase [Acidobacteriota bacterium]
MNWSGKRVVVTGAGGFIGSHLAERLVELGAETVALVRYNSSGSVGWLEESEARARLRIVQGDLGDRDRLREAFRGADTVFHLAALIGIPYSYHAPESYVRTNVVGTLHVLQAASDCGVARLVHTSTSEVYGSPERLPITETHPLQAQSPYSATKIAADMLAESFRRSFGLKASVVRPFNTFGPRQSARAVIPTIITQALTEPQVRLGSLTPTRDFVFVSDTVDGFLAAAGHDAGDVIQLGTGREVSIGELAALIVGLVGRSVPIETEPQRVRPEESEVERLLADASRARTLLGWVPRCSLEDGLRRTIDWVRSHLDRYRPSVYSV